MEQTQSNSQKDRVYLDKRRTKMNRTAGKNSDKALLMVKMLITKVVSEGAI